MSITTGAVRLFAGWGKNFDIQTAQWKDAWTYICAALDGTWGRQVFNSPGTNDNFGMVCNTGYQSHWSTIVFTANTASFNLVLPVQSFEDYTVNIYNLTYGTVKCVKVSADNYNFNCSLTVNDSYQIISTEFLLKTK